MDNLFPSDCWKIKSHGLLFEKFWWRYGNLSQHLYWHRWPNHAILEWFSGPNIILLNQAAFESSELSVFKFIWKHLIHLQFWSISVIIIAKFNHLNTWIENYDSQCWQRCWESQINDIEKMKAKHTLRINFWMKLTESLTIEVYFLYLSLIVEPEDWSDQ